MSEGERGFLPSPYDETLAHVLEQRSRWKAHTSSVPIIWITNCGLCGLRCLSFCCVQTTWNDCPSITNLRLPDNNECGSWVITDFFKCGHVDSLRKLLLR